MPEITPDQLRAVMPYAGERADVYAEHFQTTFDTFEGNTNARIAAFVAQVALESGELRYVEELADGKAYEMRSDLGNDLPGDGVKYKGHGLIQITGKANHFSVADYFGVDRQVICEWLMEPKGATLSAGWYFFSRGLWELADEESETRLEQITRRINGGLNGIDQRRAYWLKAREVFK